MGTRSVFRVTGLLPPKRYMHACSNAGQSQLGGTQYGTMKKSRHIEWPTFFSQCRVDVCLPSDDLSHRAIKPERCIVHLEGVAEWRNNISNFYLFSSYRYPVEYFHGRYCDTIGHVTIDIAGTRILLLCSRSSLAERDRAGQGRIRAALQGPSRRVHAVRGSQEGSQTGIRAGAVSCIP